MQTIRGIPARRRSTVLQCNEAELINTLPPTATPVKPAAHSQNPSLPNVSRRSLKRLRKYYLANLSSKHGSTQNQTITSGAYYRSEDADFIRLKTSDNKGDTLGTMVLESPRANRRSGMPRLLKTISQSNAVKSFGNMVPIAPNLGYFSSMRHETSNSQLHDQLPTPSETISFHIPLPLDNIVVLAGKISSRRSRRSLGSKRRNWFIEAMWEGIKRLGAVHGGIAPVNTEALPNCDNIQSGISALVDGIMPNFGPSLLHFHHKVLKVQQKRDHNMSASQEQKNTIRQEITERNQDIIQTQASWDAVEREKEELRRKESQLQKKLLLQNSTLH